MTPELVVKVLAITRQRLDDHVQNIGTSGPGSTLLDLPVEELASGGVGFRLSDVLAAAEVLFQHAEG